MLAQQVGNRGGPVGPWLLSWVDIFSSYGMPGSTGRRPSAPLIGGAVSALRRRPNALRDQSTDGRRERHSQTTSSRTPPLRTRCHDALLETDVVGIISRARGRAGTDDFAAAQRMRGRAGCIQHGRWQGLDFDAGRPAGTTATPISACRRETNREPQAKSRFAREPHAGQS